MKTSFIAKLVDKKAFEPGLYVKFLHQKRALIFDLPDLKELSNREILKITDVFVTHTHMDHFMGFDQLLRLFLGKQWYLRICGPKGIIENVDGKLRGYTWNLVQNYEGELNIEVTEIQGDTCEIVKFNSRERFKPVSALTRTLKGNEIIKEPGFKIYFITLDHQIPCLAFMLEEEFKIQILRDKLSEYGLEPGPWLTRLKQEIFRGSDENDILQIKFRKKSKVYEIEKPISELKMNLTKITEGARLVYITDIIGSEENFKTILESFSPAHIAFIEAGFLKQDEEQAKKTYHLTAEEAGRLAGLLKAKYLKVFHYSFRYKGREQELEKEARDSFYRSF